MKKILEKALAGLLDEKATSVVTSLCILSVIYLTDEEEAKYLRYINTYLFPEYPKIYTDGRGGSLYYSFPFGEFSSREKWLNLHIFLNSELDEIGLPKRLSNRLTGCYDNVREMLEKLTETELLEVQGISLKSLSDMREALGEYKLKLKN